MNELIEKAKQFAIAAHDSINHKRKYTNEPYHVHPGRVVKILESVTDDSDVIAAAWLHDVLEDVAPENSDFNESAIRENFGERVLQLVLEVTNVTTLADGNRAKRKLIERERLVKISTEGKLIKLADLIDNIIDISQNDPHFARVFRREVILDLPFLKIENNILYEQLSKLLHKR